MDKLHEMTTTVFIKFYKFINYEIYNVSIHCMYKYDRCYFIISHICWTWHTSPLITLIIKTTTNTSAFPYFLIHPSHHSYLGKIFTWGKIFTLDFFNLFKRWLPCLFKKRYEDEDSDSGLWNPEKEKEASKKRHTSCCSQTEHPEKWILLLLKNVLQLDKKDKTNKIIWFLECWKLSICTEQFIGNTRHHQDVGDCNHGKSFDVFLEWSKKYAIKYIIWH